MSTFTTTTTVHRQRRPRQDQDQVQAQAKAPSTPPPFTVGDLRKSIPESCFKHSLIKSFGYLAIDIILAVLLFYLATKISTCTEFITNNNYNNALSTTTIQIIHASAWVAYWFAQGVVFTGLWVLGHECGHGGFASSWLINDVVGLILHTALIVPYFAWKISHRKHHSATGSLEHDEVFVPSVVSSSKHASLLAEVEKEDENSKDDTFSMLKAFFGRCFSIVLMLVFGWSSYLIFNISSNLSYYKNKNAAELASLKYHLNHFSPYSPIFDAKDRASIIISDIALALFLSFLVFLSSVYSFSSVFFYYLVPYMVNVGFLVLITFLQHTDVTLPHYDSRAWTWLRGALCTIDRSFGSIIDAALHHIADTHVTHHIFSSLPHYHAQEATVHVKKVLGDYYRKDDTPIPKALYHSFKHCLAVTADTKQEGVYWF